MRCGMRRSTSTEYIHGPEPSVSVGNVDQRAPIEHHRIGYARVVVCYPFEPCAGGLNSPDVPVIRRHTTHKIDEGIVGRPQWKVAMHPRRGHINPAVRRLSRLAHEHRIARRGRVVDEPFAVARPIELGSIPQVRPQWTAARRRGKDIHVAGLRAMPARLVQIETSDESAEKPSVRISGLTRSGTSPCVRLR